MPASLLVFQMTDIIYRGYPNDRRASRFAAVTTNLGEVFLPETAPFPVVSSRIRWRDTLLSLRSREYQWYAAGLVFASIGGWFARIATDWLVLELTHDVAMVGLVIAVQLLPPTVFGAWGGVISDWIAPKTMLVLTQLAFAVLYVWLGLLVGTGSAEKFWILVISVLIGFVSCIEGPSRAVLTYQAVGVRMLPNAISLNAVLPQLGGILGTVFVGVVMSVFGIKAAVFVAALCLLVSAVSVARIHTARLEVRPNTKPGMGHIRDALRYVIRKPSIVLSLLMISVLSVSGLQASVLNAWMADSKFHTGAAGYSLFATLGTIGALIGGVLSARRRRISVFDNAVMLGVSGLIWLSCGLTPWLAPFLGGLLISGVLRMLFLVGNDTLTQLSSNAAIRGRIVALYLTVVTGGQVLGSVLMGWMVSELGADVTFVITGVVPLVVAVAICLFLWNRSRRLGRESMHLLE
ncbi:MAG: hypothetical protein B5766_03215 [Candidatus Lumbricidophila eiseniae]|uniref:Major facilitator superfamily (MFS) profile domain-containing protein n=1 Tax=Candidatus Lumbricidiphila eiseniae TaxID=1969409 RepID=A0A2A6FU46_9MICO|nr:MAG: hypothetical protein B5766_03215 [Candidatus Lumbricidophila eiseniae]